MGLICFAGVFFNIVSKSYGLLGLVLVRIPNGVWVEIWGYFVGFNGYFIMDMVTQMMILGDSLLMVICQKRNNLIRIGGMVALWLFHWLELEASGGVG